MNRNSTLANIMLVVATALATIAALMWIVAPEGFASSWLLRAGFVAGISLTIIPAFAWALTFRLRAEVVARQCLHDLSLCDASTLSEDAVEQLVSRLPTDHPWYAPYRRLCQQLVELAQRVGDAEHARARAEVRSQKLLAERKQMAEILTHLQDPVVAIDQYDELVLANPSAESLLQFSSKSTEKRALQNLVHCEQLVELLHETRRRKAPASRTSELTLLDSSGNEHSYRVTCRSLTTDGQDDRHAPHGAVAVLNDIGQLKAIQRRNAEFVSAVSHEMKAPLSGIKAYTELLADGEAEDEATREEFLGVISSQADRLQRLVENLLNLARIEAGVVEVQKQASSLNELLEGSLNVVQPAAEAKRIALTAELSPMYLEVFADRDMLLQAAINLLSNAIKYTPPGGSVVLRTRMVDNQVWFEVEDSGVGLGPEDSQRVFEKFYRVKKDSQMAQGTGLGLPLAKHIVEDVHGGSLVVESEIGKGSTFRAILPSAGCLAAAKV